jgi:hypothetical protein
MNLDGLWIGFFVLGRGVEVSKRGIEVVNQLFSRFGPGHDLARGIDDLIPEIEQLNG